METISTMHQFTHSAATQLLIAVVAIVGFITGNLSSGANGARIDPVKEPKAGEERKFEIAKDVYGILLGSVW